MPTSIAYADVPLDLASKTIRLVELVEGAESDTTIKCKFHCFPLASCPSYTALSYTWGNPYDMEAISIDNNTFPVRKNLWSFLNQMHENKKWQFFWIDAICIDQAHISERNHQVKLMKWIYSKVWYSAWLSCSWCKLANNINSGSYCSCMARTGRG
jgi:hypothetical protein